MRHRDSPGPGRPTAFLVEVDGPLRYPLTDRMVLGRAADADVRVDDPMVSARHAEVVRGDAGWRVRDLGSRRGTFVGSRRVDDAPLADGDELLIGPRRLRFELRAPVETPADASAAGELIRLRAMARLSEVIGVDHDLARIAARVVDTCLELIPGDRAALVVYQAQSTAPRLTVRRSRAGDDAPFALSTSVLAEVMATRAPYCSTTVADAALRSASLDAQGVQSVMAVPLLHAGALRGLLHLDSRAAVKVFGPRDLELASAIARQAALAIENALLVEEVQAVRVAERDRLERILHTLPVGVIATDPHGACVLANPWVMARQDVLGPVAPGAPLARIAGIPRDELPSPGVVEHRCGARTLVIAAQTADQGETVIVVTDISEEREREARLNHQDRLSLIGQLAGGIAHDFNNLLMVILNYAGFLEAEVGDALADDVRQIGIAGESAADLTRQLLTFSRSEQVQREAIEVRQVIGTLDRLMRRALGERVELVTRVAPDLPQVSANRSQFEQVVMNLLINARDAMPAGGQVTLTIGARELDEAAAAAARLAPQHYLTIEVADSGTGIPPDVLPRVFEPYFTTKPRGKGTGLGLATVHSIVQSAGGDITVASPPGSGAVFRVLWPATTLARPQRITAPPRPPGAQTLLVVDDEDQVRVLTERILRRHGYTVLSAVSGAAALALARVHDGPIHGAIVDLVMPEMSGRELARRLIEARPTMAILHMSGYHEELLDSSARCLAKPFVRNQLLDAVAAALCDNT